jgi:hypothetical protein
MHICAKCAESAGARRDGGMEFEKLLRVHTIL